MANYSIWSIDAWGNPDDGYEFNDRSRIARVSIRDSVFDTDAKIADWLRRNGFIEKGIRTASLGIEWEGEGCYWITDERTPRNKEYGYGQPCLQIERDDDD